MKVDRLGRTHRLLRRRLRLRQIDVARLSGVSRNKVSEIENARFMRVTLDELSATLAVMDAWLDARIARNGAELDRLLDEGHARLVGLVARELHQRGWQVETEVTFSEYGERGSVDLLAWHANAGALLVIEVKTELGSVEGLLRSLDVKARLASAVARRRFGWRPRSVARLVVLPEDRTARRHVDRHADLLAAALPVRSRAVRRWLADPRGAIAAMWFLSSASDDGLTRNPSAVRRVRRPQAAEAKRA